VREASVELAEIGLVNARENGVDEVLSSIIVKGDLNPPKIPAV